MIVVTISKWRQKVVWFLALVLVAAVLIGQLFSTGTAEEVIHDEEIWLQQEHLAAGSDGEADGNSFNTILEKLRGFYSGK